MSEPFTKYQQIQVDRCKTVTQRIILCTLYPVLEKVSKLSDTFMLWPEEHGFTVDYFQYTPLPKSQRSLFINTFWSGDAVYLITGIANTTTSGAGSKLKFTIDTDMDIAETLIENMIAIPY